MDFVKIKTENFEELTKLQKAYKVEIGECMPTNAELEIEQNRCAMACQGCGAVSSTSSKIGSDRIVPR